MSTSAWILSTTEALRAAESWTGRTHIHKLLFLGKELLELDPPFDFEIYRFGPYSFDLDDAIRDLVVADLLRAEYRDPGYGPSYAAAPAWDQAVSDRLPAETKAKIETLATHLGQRNVADLELIATCCWAERHGGASGDAEIKALVQNVKPKYAEDRIGEAFQEYRALQRELCSR